MEGVFCLLFDLSPVSVFGGSFCSRSLAGDGCFSGVDCFCLFGDFGDFGVRGADEFYFGFGREDGGEGGGGEGVLEEPGFGGDEEGDFGRVGGDVVCEEGGEGGNGFGGGYGDVEGGGSVGYWCSG